MDKRPIDARRRSDTFCITDIRKQHKHTTTIDGRVNGGPAEDIVQGDGRCGHRGTEAATEDDVDHHADNVRVHLL